MIRNIKHPDVQINEVDNTTIIQPPLGSTTLILGYADSGKSYFPTSPTSNQSWLNAFGKPTNDAERYFYYACKEVIDLGTNLIAMRLPYNNVMEGNYKSIGLRISDDLECNGVDAWSSDTDLRYQNIGPSLTPLAGTIDYTLPIQVSGVNLLPNKDYNTMIETQDSGAFNALDHFTIVMDQKNTLGGVDEKSGIFVVLFDYVDGVIKQRVTDAPSTTVMDNILGISLPEGSASYDKGVTVSDIWNSTTIEGVLVDNYDNFNTKLSDELRSSSISESVSGLFPAIEFINDGTEVSTEYSKWLGIAVCKASPDVNDEGKMSVQVLESFMGSIIPESKDNATNASIYLPDQINGFSKYIKLYGNRALLDDLTEGTSPILADNVAIFAPYAYPELMNFNSSDSAKRIRGDKLTEDIDLALSKVKNRKEFDIDLVVDAGLSTIAEFTDEYDTISTPENEQGSYYDSESNVEDLVISQNNQPFSWRAVVNKFRDFAQTTRKDCLAIVPSPRHMELIGAERRIKLSDPTLDFANIISPQLRYITGLNSSYAAIYTNWGLIRDSISGKNIWIPPTIKATGVHIFTELNANYWDSPAGYNRGVMSGLLGLAFQPDDLNADDLYIKSLNYAFKDKVAGYILEGQKTTQTRPSSFDRINVRKLFNRLERVTYNSLKFYVHEPNNVTTRRNILSELNPIFSDVRTRGGIFDYRLVCDESNNTPDVIDRNELNLTVMIKPTRTAEFIIGTFVGVRTGDDFGEFV